MGPLASTVGRGVRFLVRAATTLIMTVVGYFFVRELVAGGSLPPAPFGLANKGLPETLLGLPTAYTLALFGIAVLLLFGESGGSRASDGFGDGGGFGGGGDGGDGGGGE